jgi:hypothetical protein
MRQKQLLSLSPPQLSHVGAGGYGAFHILHRNPFERAVRVVLTATKVGRWEGFVDF